MPEGDSAHRTARALHAALAGAEVTRFELRVPGAAAADLRGETVREGTAHGKHILLRIGEHTLHTHLRMEGEWRVLAPGQPWPRPAHTARAVVGTAERVAVGFELGMVDLVATSDEDRVIGHLGPDPLRRDWDAAEAVRRLCADGRAIHVALLDQRNVAGFGTEYASELLFLRGTAPTRPTAEVDIPPLIDLGARALRRNVELPVRNFTGDTRRGRNLWVYGRDRRPCRRCGTPIRRGSLGPDPTRERLVFWCQRCQR